MVHNSHHLVKGRLFFTMSLITLSIALGYQKYSKELYMYINKKILSVLIISYFHINHALAYPEFEFPINTGDTADISGPSDKLNYGTVIISSASSGLGICNNPKVNYTLTKIIYEPLANFTGRTYQGSLAQDIYPLWDANAPGFALTTFGGNISDGPLVYSKPLPTETTIIWKGYTPNDQRINLSGHRMSSRLAVYKDAGRITGITTIPRQTMYRYLCQDENGTTQEVYNYYTNPYNIIGTVTGCTPVNSVAFIDMDKIAKGAIENAGSSTLLSTKKSTFSLQCDPNISVYVSVVDLSDLTNSSDTATLTPDSTATGVGFAITAPGGQRMRFGPDGSASNIPGQEKYFVRTSGNVSFSQYNPVSTQFGFSYVRKPGEEIKPGTAKSVIGITYSYQ